MSFFIRFHIPIPTCQHTLISTNLLFQFYFHFYHSWHFRRSPVCLSKACEDVFEFLFLHLPQLPHSVSYSCKSLVASERALHVALPVWDVFIRTYVIANTSRLFTRSHPPHGSLVFACCFLFCLPSLRCQLLLLLLCRRRRLHLNARQTSYSLVAVVRGSFIDSKLTVVPFDTLEYLILGFAKAVCSQGQVPLPIFHSDEFFNWISTWSYDFSSKYSTFWFKKFRNTFKQNI